MKALYRTSLRDSKSLNHNHIITQLLQATHDFRMTNISKKVINPLIKEDGLVSDGLILRKSFLGLVNYKHRLHCTATINQGLALDRLISSVRAAGFKKLLSLQNLEFKDLNNKGASCYIYINFGNNPSASQEHMHSTWNTTQILFPGPVSNSTYVRVMTFLNKHPSPSWVLISLFLATSF